MRILSTLILLPFIFSACAESSAITKDETIIDNTRNSASFLKERVRETFSFEDTSRLKKSKIQNNKEILLSSSLNSKEEVSYKDIMKNGKFGINGKSYIIHINDNLEEILINKDVQNELLKTIQLIQKRVPSDKVVGYTFSWSNQKINASPFLGDNAK